MANDGAALPLEGKPIISVLKLRGLDCSDCAAKLEKKLEQLEGVRAVSINFGAAKVRIEHTVPVEVIINAVTESGYSTDMGPESKAAKETTLSVYGLDCSDCAAKVEKRVSDMAGVERVNLNFSTGKMIVRHTVAEEAIVRVLEQAGYRAETIRTATARTGLIAGHNRGKLIATIISGVFLVLAFTGQFINAGHNITGVFYLASIASGSYYLAKSGWFALKSFSLDINFLMVVAVAGAIAIGELSEGAAVVFLFSLGNLLQAFTIEKTRSSIRSLMDLSPREALVKMGAIEVKIPVEDLKIGDIVVVRPGESIPVDGKILSGRTSVNQAPITGESAPVEKKVGDSVFAGTINCEGALEVETARSVDDTTLARIIHLVEEAQAQRAPSQQTVDRFARYYTPAVLAGALAVAVLPTLIFGLPFKPWFEKALILLVISCPCALVISTPVSIISAIGSAAKNGVLIKGGAFLEEAGRINVVAFDKTGTLTVGRPEVTDVVSFPGYTEQDVLRTAAAIEKRSEHPLAAAIMRRAGQAGISVPGVTGFESIAGKGARAEINGQTFYVGNHILYSDLGFSSANTVEKLKKLWGQGKTVIMVGTGREIMGIISVSDSIRENSAEAVKKLRQAGIKRIVMLTGDNEGTARVISESAGIVEYRANLLPRDKLDAIGELKSGGNKVAMVGDGVNDAPALATADIGIAMGGAGTDTAIETADIALMADDLSKLPYAIKLSRRALGIIKQNIAFSILIKASFIVATFMGAATLWMAVFADTGASLLVTLNGMRLLKVRGEL